MTSEKQFRSEITKRAILATIETHYKMTSEQLEILKQEIDLLVDDIQDYPIRYAK